MKPAYLRKASTHRETMSNYYRLQSHFYDSTRWAFLYGRERLIEQLEIQPGERVVEIGCGTGANFNAIQKRLRNTGELIGVDCSAPMLRKAAGRVQQRQWTNVRLLDLEYGKEAVTGGQADVVIFSYSLSMIGEWDQALSCARLELRPGGRTGVLDFCKEQRNSNWFTEWLALNHVKADRPYLDELRRMFDQQTHRRQRVWGGLWSFFMFVGAPRENAVA
jgi:S-adenosylmethionine-diacylgycerolhomoserine-N-methlytransferase